MAGRTQLVDYYWEDSRENHFPSTRQSCEDRDLWQPRRKVLDGLSYGKKEKWNDADTREERHSEADERRTVPKSCHTKHSRKKVIKKNVQQDLLP